MIREKIEVTLVVQCILSHQWSGARRRVFPSISIGLIDFFFHKHEVINNKCVRREFRMPTAYITKWYSGDDGNINFIISTGGCRMQRRILRFYAQHTFGVFITLTGVFVFSLDMSRWWAWKVKKYRKKWKSKRNVNYRVRRQKTELIWTSFSQNTGKKIPPEQRINFIGHSVDVNAKQLAIVSRATA